MFGMTAKQWREANPDLKGNIYLANPDGSEDRVSLNRKTRTYRVLRRTAQPGEGRYSHLITR